MADGPQLSRTPSVAVRRLLRQEVGFGCPVPGCRNPFLTYHHFDPPWEPRHEHRPDGMIALCRDHAHSADGGGYSNDYLRQLKAGPHAPDGVRARFPWAERGMLVRLGGCHLINCPVVVQSGGQVLMRFTRGPGGLLELSLALYARSGSLALAVHHNSFVSDPRLLDDLAVKSNLRHVQVWLRGEDTGLDLTFSRKTPLQLARLLSQDGARAWRQRRAELRRTDPELLAVLEADRDTSPSPFPAPARLPEPLDEAIATHDDVARRTMAAALAQCAASDGAIPVLDFARLRLHHRGRVLEICEGVFGRGSVRHSLFLNCPVALREFLA